MRIGIDIDDTITNTQAMIDLIALREERKIYDETKHWFYERYNCSKEEDEQFIRKYVEEFMASATVKDGAAHYIKKLHDEGHSIYIITARSDYYSPNVMDITLDYLAKNDIIYDKIIFKCISKNDICKENNIDLMIDDSIEHIKDIKNDGIDVIIMDNPYNRGVDGTRATTWKEVYEIINGR